jgi:hypothetical protein
VTYDYVARVTFEADSDAEALARKRWLDEQLREASYAYLKVRSNIYNTSAPDKPGGVEVVSAPDSAGRVVWSNEG